MDKPSELTNVVLDALKRAIRELEIYICLDQGTVGCQADLLRFQNLLDKMEQDSLDVSFRSRTF